jgi:outer membrane protein OmpA-like peptidoglycan-associated protein
MKTINTQFLTLVIAVMACTIAPSAGYAQPIEVAKNINTNDIAERLKNTVNSEYVESGPLLTKDGKRLYFSRHGHPNNVGGPRDQDIWYSEFDPATQQWSEAVNIGEPLNNAGPNFLCGVGWKGDTVLLGNVYGKKGRMSAGISLSIRNGSTWSFPTPVYVSNDYNLSDRVSYDLSADRRNLVIAEQKTDSHGKLDLYVAFRKGNTMTGTESINLGPVINSEGDETSPFLAYDGKTLYFSSDGQPGYGKLDIFVSKRLDDTWTNWSKPENLGPGINTEFDDSFFSFTPENRFAFYSRGISETNSDIYRVDMTYLFKKLDAPVKDMTQNPAEIGQTQVVEHVFDDEMPDINEAAMPEIQYIVSFLKQYPNTFVQISAHSNKHDSRTESFKLSNQRASKVMDVLIKDGIDRRRLNYVGLGHDIVANSGDGSSTKGPGSAQALASSVEFKFVKME